MEKRWLMKEIPAYDRIAELSKAININSYLSSILLQRGITDFDSARNFFRPSLDALHDPFLMKGMNNAVARLKQAIENEEKILIYGDYDVDGTTSVALVYRYLSGFYSNCEVYIPDRNAEGYGVSLAGVEWAEANGYTLVIALDCGIKSSELIEIAKMKGIDFIVCDHHLPDEFVPDAIAVLDPKQHDCEYMSNDGLTFFMRRGQLPLPNEGGTPRLAAATGALADVTIRPHRRFVRRDAAKNHRPVLRDSLRSPISTPSSTSAIPWLSDDKTAVLFLIRSGWKSEHLHLRRDLQVTRFRGVSTHIGLTHVAGPTILGSFSGRFRDRSISTGHNPDTDLIPCSPRAGRPWFSAVLIGFLARTICPYRRPDSRRSKHEEVKSPSSRVVRGWVFGLAAMRCLLHRKYRGA